MKYSLDQFHRNSPDSELVADVQRVARLLGKNAVTIDEQNEHGSFHASTLVRRFGSWPGALEKAGLQQTRTPMNIPEEELFMNIEELWSSLGRQPRYQDVAKPRSRFSVGTYEKRFGGWRNALHAFVTYINKDGAYLAEPAKEQSSSATARGSRYINWRLRFLVMRRDNFKCRACGGVAGN